MFVSVIIPVLDAAATLGEQLAALAAQEHRHFEVLVCDNGSTDGTVELVRRWEESDPRIRLLDASVRRGAGNARNVGAARAVGDLVAFCDGDDIVSPQWLSALVAGAATHAIVAGRSETITLNPRWARIARPSPEGIQDDGFLPYAGACNLAVRRAAFQQVGGFDPELEWLEDVDLCWRLQLAGHTLGYAPEALVSYRLRRSWSDLYAQGHNYGYAQAQLGHRYRLLQHARQEVSVPRPGGRWRTLWALAGTLARHPGRGGWGFLCWQAGWHLGHRAGRRVPETAALSVTPSAAGSPQATVGRGALRHLGGIPEGVAE